jgi:hypothetical protein
VGRAIRRWGIAHPHEYALLYGSPVPGYQAPGDTIAPAARVSLALIGVVLDAHRGGPLPAHTGAPAPISSRLTTDLRALLAEVAPGIGLPAETIARVIAAWTQMFGLLSFELFGQTHGVVTAHEDLFDTCAIAMAGFIGLD